MRIGRSPAISSSTCLCLISSLSMPSLSASISIMSMPVECAARQYFAYSGLRSRTTFGHWRDILESSTIMSFLLMLKNSAVSGVPALSVLVAPTSL